MLTLINGAPINGAAGGSVALGTAVGRARMILLTTRRVPAEPGTAVALSDAAGVAFTTLVPHGEPAAAAGVVGISHREQHATGTASGRAVSQNQISARATMAARAGGQALEAGRERQVHGQAHARADIRGDARSALLATGEALATGDTSGIDWREKVDTGALTGRAVTTGVGETLRPTSVLEAGGRVEGHAASELFMTATASARARGRGPVPGDRLVTGTTTARAGASGVLGNKNAVMQARITARATGTMTATRQAYASGQESSRAFTRSRGVRRLGFVHSTARARATTSIDLVQLGTGTFRAQASAGGVAGKEYQATATMQARAISQARAGIEYTMTGLPAAARASVQGHGFAEVRGTNRDMTARARGVGQAVRLAIGHGELAAFARLSGRMTRVQVGTATMLARAVEQANAQLIAQPSSAPLGRAEVLSRVTPLRDAEGLISAVSRASGRNYAVRHLSSRVRISSTSNAEATGGRVTVFYTGAATARAWVGASDDHLYVYDGWAPISRTLVVTPQTRAF